MPLPKITPTEDRQEFIKRCMNDVVMKSEYPNAKQRLAICAIQAKK